YQSQSQSQYKSDWIYHLQRLSNAPLIQHYSHRYQHRWENQKFLEVSLAQENAPIPAQGLQSQALPPHWLYLEHLPLSLEYQSLPVATDSSSNPRSAQSL